MPAKPRVTQMAIAQELGVSQFTVSEALRGTANVSQRTRELVTETARRHGYRLNASARAIVTGRFNAVALLRVIDDKEEWFSTNLVNGSEVALEERRMRLLIARVPRHLLEDDRYVPEILREWSADGVLVHCQKAPPPRLPELLARYQIPAIWVNTKRPNDCVYPDDFGLARTATERLAGLGHRKIVFVPAWSAHHYSAEERKQGYRAAMQAGSLAPLILDRSDEKSRRDAMIRTRLGELICAKAVTGVVCYGHSEARLAMYAAMEIGKRVPQEISVVCCASDVADYGDDTTAVSTLELSWIDMGRKAVEMLLKKIDDPAVPLNAVMMPCRWIDGRTVDRPAQ